MMATSFAGEQISSDVEIDKCRMETSDLVRLQCYDQIKIATSGAVETPPAPSSHAAASSTPAILKYLNDAEKALELERIMGRYSDGDGASAANALRPSFDAAYNAAEVSQPTRAALDEHWLALNRCLNPGNSTRFEKNRLYASCSGDLSAAKAKVELAWSRK